MTPSNVWCPNSHWTRGSTRHLASRFSLSALLTAAVLAFGASNAAAQGSDDCSTAQNIGNAFGAFPYNTGVATTGTQGQAEAICNFFSSTAISKDVWYTWQAPASGSVTLTICGGVLSGSTDTKVAVYDGAGCPGAAAIACNDDFCSLTSQLSFTAVSGNSYTIQLGAFPGDPGGTGNMTLSGPPVPPVNDDCAAATAISGTGAFPFNTTNATTGTQGQAQVSCGGASVFKDVWFAWTAPATPGIATINNCASAAFDSKIAVYLGAGCPAGAALACNDDFCGTQSQVQIAFTPGAVYMIQVGAFSSTGGGAGNLNITVGPPQIKISQIYGGGGNQAAPLLTDFIELYNAGPVAQPLAGWAVQYNSDTGTGTWQVTNIGLITTTILPGQYYLVAEANGTTNPAGHSIALPTPDATGTIAMAAGAGRVAVTFNNTALVGAAPATATIVDLIGFGATAVFREPTVGGTVANNTPTPSSNNSLYRLGCGSVDTDNNAADTSVGYVCPRNSLTALNGGATALGMAYPYFAEETQTVRLVVYPYRCGTGLPATATISVDCSSIGAGTVSLLDTGIGGDELAADGLYSANVTVAPGTLVGSKQMPVSISSGGFTGGEYIALEVRPIATPDNDNCSTAFALSGAFPQSAASDLLGATAEWNVFQIGTAPTGFQNVPAKRGIWFSFTGTGNTMTLDTCASPLNASAAIPDTQVNIFGGPCENLTWIAGNDDNATLCGVGTGTERRSRVSMCTVAGATYYACVVPFSTVTVSNPIVFTATDDGIACGTAVPLATCPPPTVPGAIAETEAGFGIANDDGCDALFTATMPPSAAHRFFAATATFPATSYRGTSRGWHSNRDVDWYRFQAASTGLLNVSYTAQYLGVCGIYQLSATGECTLNILGLAPLAQSPVNNRCGTVTASASVTAGNWYAVRVIPLNTGLGGLFGGVAPSASAYNYLLSLELGGAPGNDACASATSVAVPSSTSGTTTGATNDGTSTCDGTGRDVWYQFTLASATAVVIDTAGSTSDTVISLYGACGSAALDCNDNAIGTCFATSPASAIGPTTLAAGTYRVRVSDKNAGSGIAFTLNIRNQFNDNCCGALSIAIPSVTNGTTVGATLDAPLPPVCDGPGVADAGGNTAITAPSVWYSVVSPINQTIYADTVTAGYDSKISVYTGTCGALTCVTMNDDILANFHSKVGWQAVAGQQYLVMVHGFGTATGTFSLNVTASPTPSNDLCGSASVVSGATGNSAGTLVGATGDNSTITSDVLAGICAPDFTYWDVWYSWTAPCTGTANFDTCGTWDTVLSIHSACPTPSAGNAISGACNNDGPVGCTPGSSLSFAATAGTNYLVRVATSGAQAAAAGGGQPFTLTWSMSGLVDTDGDLTPDCFDGCPLNAALTAPTTFFADLDGDTFGAGAGVLSCGGPGLVLNNTDCDDTNAAVNPGATEVCNTIDDDCDTFIDEGVQLTFYQDSDGDGFGNAGVTTLACSAPSGFVSDNTDCNDGNAAINPGASEVCDLIDNDCDTFIDEGVQLTFFQDADGDGFGNPGVTTLACTAPSGFVSNSGDCNDGNAAVNPTAAEVCDGIDNNCAAGIDEGFDADADAVADCFDNCPTIANPTQADLDADNVGDACDNCPAISNPTQADCDLNGIGDACEGQPDCNMNGIPDNCDIAGGGSQDINTNGVPDECESLVPFCFGDGSINGGPDCPCGNNVAPGVQRGCVNSTGNGARLLGSGTASISGDSLNLTASSMTATTTAIFIQGTAPENAGLGSAPLFDGLRCVTGSVTRLSTRIASGGTAAIGFPGTPVSLLGGVGAPGTYYYQVIYRNAVGPCGALANTTNGLQVLWTP